MNFGKMLSILSLFSLSIVGCSGSDTPNQVPEANAGVAQTVDEGVSVTLNGSGADTDGTITSYNWRQVSGAAVSLNNSSSAQANFIAPDTKQLANLEFELTVTDNDGASATDRVIVMVNPVNVAPSATVSEDKAVDEQTVVGLSVQAIDSDGEIVSFNWVQSSGSSVEINDSSLATISFTAPTTKEVLQLEFEVTVTDDEGATAKDSVQVTVNPVNTLPTAIASEDMTVNEKSFVQLMVNANDSDGDVVSYLWQQVSGSTIVLENTSAASFSFTSPVVKTEQVLEFQVTVTDDEGGAGTDLVAVTVSPVKEINFAIAGKAQVINPLVNADISVEVGNQLFTTKTNDLGDYNLNIELDEDFAQSLIIIEALDANPSIWLVSLLDNALTLSQLSGSDNSLSSSEHMGTNLNHISTAVAGLAHRALGKRPTTLEEATQFVSNDHVILSSFDVIETAALIKRGLDTENVAAGPLNLVTNTYDLVVDIDLHAGVYKGIFADPLQKDAYLAEVFDVRNNNAFVGNYNLIPDVYIGKTPGSIEDESIIPDNIWIDFTSNNSGKFAVDSNEQNISLINNTSSLNLTLGETVRTIQVGRTVSGSFTLVDRETVYDAIELHLMARVGNVDLVRYTLDWHYHYPNGEFADEAQTPFSTVAFLYNKTLPMTNEDLIGTRSIPVFANFVQASNESPSVRSLSFNFQEGGTATINEPNTALIEFLSNSGSVSWSIPASGSATGQLSMGINDMAMRVVKLAEDFYSSRLYSQDGLEGIMTEQSYLKPAGTEWSADTIAGVYEDPNLLLLGDSYVGLQLNADNTGRLIEGYDDDENGVIDAAEYFTETVTWVINNEHLEVTTPNGIDTYELMEVDGNKYRFVLLHSSGTGTSMEEILSSFFFIKKDRSPLD